MANTKILLVDDQQLILDGIKIIVDSEPDFDVIGLAYNGEDAIALTEIHKPDIVLMDIRMPGMGGVEATMHIKDKYPQTQVIILTTFDDDAYIIDALNYGASGYLLKDIGREKLIDSIREAMAGNLLITGKVAYKLAKSIKTHKKPTPQGHYNPYGFTDRELEIAKLLVQGLSNKEIGSLLFISQGTVKNYMSSIYLKLGVNDRSKAIVLLSASSMD